MRDSDLLLYGGGVESQIVHHVALERSVPRLQRQRLQHRTIVLQCCYSHHTTTTTSITAAQRGARGGGLLLLT